MEIVIELFVYIFLYLTGFVVTYLILFGMLKPEIVSWKISKDWQFGTFVHRKNNKLYLDWEWVTGEQLLRKAIELNPNYAYAYNRLGEVCMLNKRFDEGKALYQKALSLDPKNRAAQHALKSL